MDDVLKIDINSELALLIDESSLSDGELLPISKKITKSFRRFYLESLLCESPSRHPSLYTVPFDNWTFNQEEAAAYIRGEKGKFIDYFNFKSYKLSIYKKIEVSDNNKIEEYIIIFNEKECKNIFAFLRLKHITINNVKYFFTNGIWNNKTYATGLIFEFFTKWLLPKYKLIISDNLTSKLGENFWFKIIEYALTNNKNCGIYTEYDITSNNKSNFKQLFKKENFLKAWKKHASKQRIYISE